MFHLRVMLHDESVRQFYLSLQISYPAAIQYYASKSPTTLPAQIQTTSHDHRRVACDASVTVYAKHRYSLPPPSLCPPSGHHNTAQSPGDEKNLTVVVVLIFILVRYFIVLFSQECGSDKSLGRCDGLCDMRHIGYILAMMEILCEILTQCVCEAIILYTEMLTIVMLKILTIGKLIMGPRYRYHQHMYPKQLLFDQRSRSSACDTDIASQIELSHRCLISKIDHLKTRKSDKQFFQILIGCTQDDGDMKKI